jgi:hypothetical protein
MNSECSDAILRIQVIEVLSEVDVGCLGLTVSCVLVVYIIIIIIIIIVIKLTMHMNTKEDGECNISK